MLFFVAAGLIFSGDVLRNPPFDVELIVAERALRLDVARRLDDRENAVGHGPARRRLVLRCDPLAQVVAGDGHDRNPAQRDGTVERRTLSGTDDAVLSPALCETNGTM